MRIMLALAISVSSIAFSAPLSSQPAAAETGQDARFEKFGESVVDEYLKLDPVTATQVGEHRYDAQLPDVSAAGRAALLH